MLYNHLILCCPLLLLPSVFPSIRVFFSESALHIRWSKFWSFSFSISPSNEYSGLISFGINWCDLLAVQGTLKNLLQHYSSKTSILLCSAFFIVQLSHPYMTPGKNTGLQTLGGSDSKEFSCNAGDLGLFPGSGRFPGEGNGYTPVILPGEFHEQRRLVCYNRWGHKKLDTAEQLTLSRFTGKTIVLTIRPLSAKWCLCFLICCLGF